MADRKADACADGADDHHLDARATQRQSGYATLRRPDGEESQQRARQADTSARFNEKKKYV